MEEAWEWARIQREPCPHCGMCPSAVDMPTLGALAVDAGRSWEHVLTTGTRLRARPAPDVWTPLEYALHVRDMFEVFGGRIVATVETDNPIFDWSIHDPDGAYNDADPGTSARQIRDSAERFGALLSTLTKDQLGRPGRRRGPNGGDEATDDFTVAGLACFGAHEAHHHRLDACGVFLR